MFRVRALRPFVLCLLAGSVFGNTLDLSMTRDSGGIMLSWPVSADDAILEYSPVSPPSSEWGSIARSLYQSNSAGFFFRVQVSEQSRFFRLRRVAPPAPGLIGHWSLDQGTSTAGADPTAFGADFNTTNAYLVAGRFGSSSLLFDGQPVTAGGSLAWINNGHYQVLPPTGAPFSVSLWFAPDELPTRMRPVVGTGGAAKDGWHVALDCPGPGTNDLILTSTSTAGSLSLTGKVSLVQGQWHRLTVTSDGLRSRLYLDSSVVAQGPLGLRNSQEPLYLGGLSETSPTFVGRIDEIRAYTNALTPEQLAISAEWDFNENAGNLAWDTGIHGHQLASVTSSNAWAPGKSGSGINTAAGSVVIPNEDYRVLPASGGSFSVSAWIRPRTMPYGASGLLSCSQGTSAGWQATLDADTSGQLWIQFTSTNQGGTLALRAPAGITLETWTRIDLTYNGGIATVYANGRKLGSESGAIRGSESPLIVGAAPGTANFDGVIDEVRIYARELADWEIGPIALPMWEMALLNSATNLVLAGSGPTGKTLTYSILSSRTTSSGTIDYSANSPIITYRAGGKKGPDFFVYTVSDGEFTSLPATGVVSVVQPHYLSPAGGPEQPRDGTSPSRAWAASSAAQLDPIWKTNNYYDCFFYAPGEYETTGWKYLERSTANPGCKHIGSGAQGPNRTVVRLVNTWHAWGEGVIFSPLHGYVHADDFEVRNMLLDCNATNNPKYAVGEPVWLRIPLTATSRVESVTFRWSDTVVQGNSLWKIGPASEFSLCTVMPGTNGYSTNCPPIASTGTLDVVPLGAITDELLVRLSRRAEAVDFYGLKELEINGGSISLPTATRPDGAESRLDAQHSIFMAVDKSTASSWASGPEDQVQITLPLTPGTVVSRVEFQWNCQTLPDLRRLGPAAEFLLFWRDQASGDLKHIPVVPGVRSVGGRQTVDFGTNSVRTDQLVILLTARESGVDSYALSEIELKNGSATVPMRLPSASTTWAWGRNYSILNCMDGDAQTEWASSTQGAVHAIAVRGSNLKFTGLKIVGFGTKAARECFALAVHALAPDTPVRNILVEDCVITEPAPNNTDGLSAIAVVGRGKTMSNAAIRRCSVIGVSPQFPISNAFGGPLIENCYASNCTVGVYFEPIAAFTERDGLDSVGPVMIRSNVFINVAMGVTVDFHPASNFESLTCIGNEIVLPGTQPRSYGIGACDTCQAGVPGTITNLTALGNIIRYPDWAPRPAATEVGLVYGNFLHGVYGNNLVALGTGGPLRVRSYPAGVIPAKTTPEDCDRPGRVEPGPSTIPPSLDALPPGYRRAWYNNRDLNGALLPVRYRYFGVERPALQQQWPE